MCPAKRFNSGGDAINPSRNSLCRSKNSVHSMVKMYHPGHGVFRSRGFYGEAVSCPIQATFHRPQIAPGDFSDLLVALPLELPEYEHLPVVFRQPLDALVHRILQESFAVQVVRTCSRILELQRPMVSFPVLLDGLEQHQRIAAAVAQLVLREVGCDRVDPGREFLGLVETVQVTEHPDEDFLHQILSPLAVADRPIDEVEEAGLIAVDESPEGLGLTSQMPHHDLAVVQLMQCFAL